MTKYFSNSMREANEKLNRASNQFIKGSRGAKTELVISISMTLIIIVMLLMSVSCTKKEVIIDKNLVSPKGETLILTANNPIHHLLCHSKVYIYYI